MGLNMLTLFSATVAVCLTDYWATAAGVCCTRYKLCTQTIEATKCVCVSKAGLVRQDPGLHRLFRPDGDIHRSLQGLKLPALVS